MLTPKKIAARLVKAMKSGSVQMIDRLKAPNIYIVQVPDDFMDYWHILKLVLEKELCEHLAIYAEKHRNYELAGPIDVKLLCGMGIKGNRVEVNSQFSRPQAPQARLTSVEGLIIPLDYPLIKPVTLIGRGSGDISLPRDKTFISRRHAQITLFKQEIIIRDLDSRSGTFVNGTTINQSRLLTGDIITIGDISLQMEGDG